MEGGSMPLFHCTKCHHEWESADKVSVCDWCCALGKILEEKTSMEEVNWEELLDRFKTLREESMNTDRPIITATQKKERRNR